MSRRHRLELGRLGFLRCLGCLGCLLAIHSPSAAGTEPGSDEAAPPAIRYERLSDPTRPARAIRRARAATTGPAAPLELSAIIVGEGHRSAVINGRRVRAGDRVAGAQVLAIDPSHVRLRGAGEAFSLFLTRSRVKTPAGGNPVEEEPEVESQ